MGYPSVVLRQWTHPPPLRLISRPLSPTPPPCPHACPTNGTNVDVAGSVDDVGFSCCLGTRPALRPRLSPPHQCKRTAALRSASRHGISSPTSSGAEKTEGAARKHTAPPQGRRAAVENIGPGGSFPTRGAARRPRPRPSRACPGMRMFPPPLPWIPLRLTTQTPTPTTQHARCRTAKQMPECDAADWCGLGFRPSHGRRVPTLHSTAPQTPAREPAK